MAAPAFRRALMHINFARGVRSIILFICRRTLDMPTETVVIIAAIIAAFVIYAATLAWADFYSHHGPKT
jgi:hypothetical protein